MTAKRNNTPTPSREPDDFDRPFTDDEFERGLGAALARRARQVTGLTQAAFAERYGIPAASLRDWEQGRRSPDSATKNYLRVIAKMPDDVAHALHDAA
jgi:putative transcriptional regulator